MSFSKTIQHESKVTDERGNLLFPDVKFTVRRMGLAPRTELDEKTLKWRQRKREIEAEFPEQSPKEQELRKQLAVAFKKLAALKDDPDAQQKCFDDDVVPLQRDINAQLTVAVKSKRAVLEEENALLNLRICNEWIKAGLISIDSGEFGGATIDEVMEFAPQDLTSEIYNVLANDGRLAGKEAENFRSRGTSSEAVPQTTETSPTTAKPASGVATTP